MRFAHRTIIALATLVLVAFSSVSPSTAQVSSVRQDTAADYRVSVIVGSQINLVSSQSRVPIQVRNLYPEDVRVFLVVQPTALWLTMPKLTEVRVPAQTTINATVPISAIANGDSELKVRLISFSGVSLGDAVWLKIHVERGLEPLLLGGFISIVVVLGAVGGLRMSRRRKLEAGK